MATTDDRATLPSRRWSPGRLFFLAVTGLCLYLLLPSLAEVFEAWKHLGDFQPAWVVVMLVCETLSFACVWLLQAITLRCDDPFVITTTQLAGNAFNRVTPGGGATGTALQARMLADAGFELSYAGSALAMQSLLISAAVVAMPILAIPAIIAGTQVPGKLVAAVWVGAFVFVVMLGAGAVFMVTRRPVLLVARAVARVMRFFRRPLREGFEERLIEQRDRVRETLGRRWPEALAAAVGRWGFEYFVLLVALEAMGAHADPWLVLLAFVAASALGMIPLTPGGLGFVEAGLTGTLALAGVHADLAVLATLGFRLVSFWLPIPAGLIAAWLFRRRFPRVTARA